MTGWTLEGEVQKLANQIGTVEALRALGLVGSDETFDGLETIAEWHRSGDETYSSLFSVCSRLYVMKACVAFNWHQKLGEIFAGWLARRSLLNDLGVSTPTLYGASGALLVEEHIPHTLADALVAGDGANAILPAIGRTAALLVNAGFVPLRADDWRSRGDDVVLVDFGEDLGPPRMTRASESGLLSEVLDNIAGAGVVLSPAELQVIGRTYEMVLDV